MKNLSKVVLALFVINSVSAFADELKVSCYAAHFAMGSNGYYQSEIVSRDEKMLALNEGEDEANVNIELQFTAAGSDVTLKGSGSLFQRTTEIDEATQIVTRSGSVTADVKIPDRNIDLSLNDGLMIDLNNIGIQEGIIGKSTVSIKLSDKPEDIYTVGCSMSRKI